jgi:uncharacterized membrane protein
VACGALWLGNFVVTGIWSIRAFASKNAALRAFAVREIIFTDIVFTLAAGSIVVMTGMLLAAMEHIAVLSTLWTRDALIIAVASGVMWLAVLVPLELRMKRLAAAGADGPLQHSFVWWNIGGWTVTAALFFIIYLMLGKPT